MMNIELSSYIEKGKQYIEQLKVHSFGNKLMRKRSISTLEKLILYAGFSLFCLILSLAFVIFPGVQNFRTLLSEKQVAYEKIYGVPGKQGILYVNQQKQKTLQEKETKFAEEQKIEIEKYNQALLKDSNIYNIAVLLEDYALTFHTEERPLIVSNITFGKIDAVKIDAKDLKQDTSQLKLVSGVEYRVVPMTVSVEASKEKFEQFIEFIYHSGDTEQFYFKGKPVPLMSIESLNLPSEIDQNVAQTYSLKIHLYLQKEEIQKNIPLTQK